MMAVFGFPVVESPPAAATHKIKNGWAITQLAAYGRVLRMVPVAWLDRLNNPTPAAQTNLLDMTTMVDMDGLWENVQRLGLRDPVLLHLCEPEGWARVEAGNQRVQMAITKGETFLPAICLVTAKPLIEAGNGTHLFDATPDLLLPRRPAGEVVERLLPPTAVFASLQKWEAAGLLPDPRTYGLRG